MYAWCLQQSDEGIITSGTGIGDGAALWVLEIETSVFQRQQLLKSEPSLQLYCYILDPESKTKRKCRQINSFAKD